VKFKSLLVNTLVVVSTIGVVGVGVEKANAGTKINLCVDNVCVNSGSSHRNRHDNVNYYNDYNYNNHQRNDRNNYHRIRDNYENFYYRERYRVNHDYDYNDYYHNQNNRKGIIIRF
jgi:hypothetical protein